MIEPPADGHLPIESTMYETLRIPFAVAAFVMAFRAGCPQALAQETGASGDVFSTADSLERAGRLADAAHALEALLPLYPQDYTLPVRIAELYRRAGRLADAERFYEIALALSPDGVDARAGLATVLEADGRCADAHAIWERLAADLPDLASARAGAARCAAVHVTPSVTLTGTMFPDHPYKSMSGGVAAGLTLEHRSGFFIGGTYRYAHFLPAAGAMLSAWDQHEGYVDVGWGARAGGFSLHYAVVYDGSGTLGTSHHVGATLRWSPFGDIEADVAGSFYDDMKIVRAEPSWRIPIAFGLSIRPALAIADAGGEVVATGMGTLAFDTARFHLWVGGKYGDEVRPVYFAAPVVYDVLERIPYGAWAGVSVDVARSASLHLAYAMDRLKQPTGTESDAHTLSLGAAATF